jgi:DNA-binding NarL/FixJ family response regulator
MASSEILLAHERPAIVRAVRHVLEFDGFAVQSVRDGTAALAALERQAWGALVVDVALPEIPGYELTEVAKRLAGEDPPRGAGVVVLIPSIYRRTSYKRRPTRLYGAADYVEIHHLGDMLAPKLRALLSLPSRVPPSEVQDETAAVLRSEGDRRMSEADAASLASVIVADMILYNGDRILGAGDAREAEEAVAEDLEMARALFAQAVRHAGVTDASADPIGEAFRALMTVMGRPSGGP